ncbi:MAG TPA: hypothetical protein H9913_05440 [Candidatus Blautia stercoripullorum]|uniref:Uncharacterized protein n=1 Tax=Candidatus Blautia stercoripullorum TaxID=2838502 RepID=A0A9D2U4E3_9FIRM|nr:hypothetical protein [Candidatus Blautia stercoripullorum]
MNKNCQLFYKRLRTLFPSIGFAEGKFLRDIKMQLRDYSIENPNAKYEDVVKFFGNPEDVYVDYIKNQEEGRIYLKFQLKKRIRNAIGFLVLIVLFLWITYFLIWWKGYDIFSNNIPNVKVTTIEEGE